MVSTCIRLLRGTSALRWHPRGRSRLALRPATAHLHASNEIRHSQFGCALRVTVLFLGLGGAVVGLGGCGTGARGEPPGLAGVHPTEQRFHEPVHHLVTEPARDESPTERSSSTDARPFGSTRASPSRRGHLTRAGSGSTGTPITERGSGRSAPRVQIRDECTPGARPRAQLRASATPSGRRLSIASAPTSTTTPPTSMRRSLPPGSGAASSTVTSCPPAEDVGRGQPGEPTAHDQYPHGSSLAVDLVPPRAGCGSGRHEESQAGSDSRPNALRWKTSGERCPVFDRVEREDHDRVVAGLDLAVDAAVEAGQPLVQGDGPVPGRRTGTSSKRCSTGPARRRQTSPWWSASTVRPRCAARRRSGQVFEVFATENDTSGARGSPR